METTITETTAIILETIERIKIENRIITTLGYQRIQIQIYFNHYNSANNLSQLSFNDSSYNPSYIRLNPYANNIPQQSTYPFLGVSHQNMFPNQV